jgi:hypothetical protein
MKPLESTQGKILQGFFWKISLLGVSRLAAKETKACLEKLEVGPFDLSLVRWWKSFPDLLRKAEYPFTFAHCSRNKNRFLSRIVTVDIGKRDKNRI